MPTGVYNYTQYTIFKSLQNCWAKGGGDNVDGCSKGEFECFPQLLIRLTIITSARSPGYRHTPNAVHHLK